MSPSRLLRAIIWSWRNLPTLFGYAYTAALLTLGGFVLTGQASHQVHTIFVAGLWGYAGLGVLNFYVMMIFIYNDCCIDRQGLLKHLGHGPLARYPFEIAMSIIWPLNWHLTLRGQAGECDWVGIVVWTNVQWLCGLRKPRSDPRPIETIHFK